MSVKPHHCPLCCKPIVARRIECGDCGIFWCFKCQRWRGYTMGADDNMPDVCDECWMPGGRTPEADRDIFEGLRGTA